LKPELRTFSARREYTARRSVTQQLRAVHCGEYQRLSRSEAAQWTAGARNLVAPAHPLHTTTATLYAPHVEGELGAVLQQLERGGMVLPLRERGQPVYHVTVARDRTVSPLSRSERS
jgi:hypothetical protein